MKKLSLFIFIISILFIPVYFSQARGGNGFSDFWNDTTYSECGTGISFENFLTKSDLNLLCEVGVSSNIVLSHTGNLYTWNCEGSAPDNDAQCFVKKKNNTDNTNAKCNTSINGKELTEKPNKDTLCEVGTSTGALLSTNGKLYKWICNGLNTNSVPARCYAYNNNNNNDDSTIYGVCGLYDGSLYDTTPTNLCSKGHPIGFPGTSDTDYNWDCSVTRGRITPCTVSKIISIDGECGISSGDSVTEQPTTNLCKTGSVLPFEGNSEARLVEGEWRWICKGVDGGDNSPLCSATVIPTCIDPQTLVDNVCIDPDPTPTCDETENTLIDDVCTPCDLSANTIIDNVCTENKITDDTPKIDASSKASGLIPECPASGCGFEEFMKLVNTIIKFLLFDIATPLAALAFTYAGFLLITAGGDPGKMTQAKAIIKNVLIGFVIALAAWLIVNTILSSLGFTGTFLT